MLDNKNPVLIQGAGIDCNENATPLVLIHDGGGTIFSYFCLGSLGRKVYGISNPRFFSGRPWVGGIVQMCKLYVKLIQTVISHGKILLGGWSFGGIVSVELTKQLAQTNITVAGIVMVDSICPLAFKDKTKLECRPITEDTPASTAHTRPEMKLMVTRCMKQAGDLLYSWDIPEFAPRRYTTKRWPPAIQSEKATVTATELDVDNDSSSEFAGHSSSYSDGSLTSSRRSSNTSYASDFDSDLDMISSTTSPSTSSNTKPDLDLGTLDHSLLSLPSVALLRCSDYVPTAISSSNAVPDGICKVDITRDMPHLGWEEQDTNMINYTKPIAGHHFNIFAPEHVEGTTRDIRNACLWLDCNQ